MPPAQILAELRAGLVRCDELVVGAHYQDAQGNYVFSHENRKQITKTALLNLFIYWESFLEKMIVAIMMGETPINGTVVQKYVAPSNEQMAQSMLVGTLRFFDFSNHDNVRKVSINFFNQGHPFAANISSIAIHLQDLKTLRNACAHITSSTQTALESLAFRLLVSRRLV